MHASSAIVDDGTKLGVQGTPAFFINDWLLGGAYPFSEFQKIDRQGRAGPSSGADADAAAAQRTAV